MAWYGNILDKVRKLSLPVVCSAVAALSPIKSSADTYSVICGGHTDGNFDQFISSTSLGFYQMLKVNNVSDQNQELFLNKSGRTGIWSARDLNWSGDDDWALQNLLVFPTTAQIDYEDDSITAVNFLNAIKNSPTTKEDNLIIHLNCHALKDNGGYWDLFTGGAGGSSWEGVPLDGRNLKGYMLNKVLKNKQFNKCYVFSDACYADSVVRGINKDQNGQVSKLENVIAIASTKDDELEGGVYFSHYLAHLIRNNPNETVYNLLQQADSLNNPENAVIHYFGDSTYLDNWIKNHSFWDVDSNMLKIQKKKLCLDDYIKASPNPFTRSINLNYNKNKFPFVSIYSSNGQFIENVNNVFSPKNLPAGTYFAILKNNKNKVVKKLNYLK